MAYNKAKEERKWRIWKQAEEKMLRESGVSEDKITNLHEHDWAIFNSDRRYYQKLQRAGTYLDEVAAAEQVIEIKTVDGLLNSISNERLHQVLITVDKLTVQILLWKIEGYSSIEISKICGLSVDAIDFRMWHLRKKIKNIL